MGKFQKFLCLLLTLIMMITVFTSCKGKEEVVWESYYENVPGYTTGDSSKDTTTDDKNNNSSSSTGSGSASGSQGGTSAPPVDTSATKGRFEGLNYKGKTLKILVWYDPDTWEQSIYDQFEDMTGAKIKFIRQAGTADTGKLASLVASGDSPNMAMMNETQFPSHITKKLAQPVTKYVDKSKDTWLAYDIMDNTKIKGDYYGVTDYRWGDTVFVYYNKDLFNAALDVEQDPGELYEAGKWNWNTFYDLAKKMTKKDKSGNITQYGSKSTSNNAFALSAGATLISANNGNFTASINTKQMKDAAEMEKKLRKDGYYSTDSKGDFSMGNLAMYVYPQYPLRAPYKYFKNINWGVVPFPSYPNGKSYTPSSLQMGIVPAGAKNVEASYMLINWRCYCQSTMSTMTDMPAENKELYKKVSSTNPCTPFDMGILDQMYRIYTDLNDPTKSTQTTIDEYIPIINQKIDEYKEEVELYK